MSIGTLYHSYGSRSSRVYRMILELQLDVEVKSISLSKGEGRNPEYLKINPVGKVPSYIDKDVSLFESVAICFYLLDKYDNNFKFGGAPGSPQRANVYKWASYVSSSVDDIVIPLYLHKIGFVPQIRNKRIVEENTFKFERDIAPVLKFGLKGQKYFGGDEFSAVDVIVGYILGISNRAGILDKYPDLKEYAERVSQRDHYISALKDYSWD